MSTPLALASYGEIVAELSARGIPFVLAAGEGDQAPVWYTGRREALLDAAKHIRDIVAQDHAAEALNCSKALSPEGGAA